MRSDGWEITVHASMLEIYNEELRDLLCQDNHNGSSKSSSSSSSAATKDKLKVSNLQGFVTVAGLTSLELDTRDLRSGTRHLEQLLDKANKSRMTACTAMNERSSRSHALFMLDIAAKHSDGTTYLRGGLRLCDLAGSERLDRTGTASDAARLKETVNINKSLSCLADVFVALANKAPHVPYRNSKLTMVLQDCLSGDGKALMFVHVSPTAASTQETLCSLRFANQVSPVELGKATKSVFNVMPPAMQPPQTNNVIATSSSSSSSGMNGGDGNVGASNSHTLRGTNHNNNNNPKTLRAVTGGATRSVGGTNTRQQAHASTHANAPLSILAQPTTTTMMSTDGELDDDDLPQEATSMASLRTLPFATTGTVEGTNMTSTSLLSTRSTRTTVGAKRSAAVLSNAAIASTNITTPSMTSVGESNMGPPSKRSRQSMLVTTTTTSTNNASSLVPPPPSSAVTNGITGGASRGTWR